MRILFLNLYFPPDTSATAKSAESMVHALARTHEVTVLCGRPSYDPTERRPWKLWQTERLSTKNAQSIGETAGPSAATFTVIRVGSTDYPRIQMNRRILNYLTYSKLAAWRAFFIPCDVIFAMTDPPFNGIVAAVLSLLKRKPLLYDIQDMYPDMAVAGSIVQPGLLTRFWERVHRWALRRAARIIVLGDDMRARIIAKGPTGSNGIDPAKVFIVRSGVDTGLANSSILNPEVTRAIRGNFRFVLLHAGNLGFYGAWDTIIAAARQLENENIGFVFVGDGAERSRLEGLAAGATNVRFLSFFPSSDLPSVLAAPDAHIVTIKRGLEGVVVPSKMFGIIAAGKPIVAIASPQADVATLGVRHGFAICVDPASPDELASGIRRLAADPAAVASMSQAALTAAAQYSQASELNNLVSLVNSMARHS
jgi:colanic acid biosynthesis glycosyl transferase WcaI